MVQSTLFKRFGGIVMRGNNRAVETLTFYQWLNQYKLTQKKEYKTFQKEVQENLRREYEM